MRSIKSIDGGMLKVWFDQAGYAYQKIAMTVAAVGVLRLSGVPWWIMGLGTIGVLLVMAVWIYVYISFIYPKEQKYLDEKRPVFREIRDRVRSIDNKVSNG